LRTAGSLLLTLVVQHHIIWLAMIFETPLPTLPLRGELLLRVAQRHPNLDMDVIQTAVLIQAVARSLSARINENLAKSGLTEGKFYVIVFLFSEDLLGHEAPSPSDIAANLDVTRGTITGLLDGLEQEGYVERVRDPHDRRALTIRISDKARHFMDDYLNNGPVLFAKQINLDNEEKRVMTECLARILSTLLDSNPG